MTVTQSSYALQRNDLYQTPEWVTAALLRHFPVNGLTVWEPAAGNHRIARVLRNAGANVVTSDIERYDVDHDFVMDFRNDWSLSYPKQHFDAILSNPPYGKQNRLAAQFCALALQRCDGLVAMLLTAKFDSGSTRHHLFRDNDRFTAKIVLVDRISWFDNDDGGTEDHAWFVWTAEADHEPMLIYEENMPYNSNLTKPIGQFTIDPNKYVAEGWYDLGGNRGRWYFNRRDPVIITDAYRQNPVLVHVNFITRGDGYLVAENKDNGFAYPAVPPGADRVWPVTMFHPFGAKFS